MTSAPPSSRKVAIVTGSSSGIGRETAIKLSSDGWSVVLSARREAQLEETAKMCVNETLVVAGDVSVESYVKKLFEEAVKAFGRVDMVFNNAGISGSRARLDEITLEAFQNVVDVNLTASFLCSREAFDIFTKQQPQGGRIINNGSIAARVPRPHAGPYTITKHAITGLTKQIALDGRPFNITATQIDVGNAATDMSAHSAKGTLQPNGSTKVEARMDAKHVANTVAYVASLPNNVTVLEMIVMAAEMPFVGRG